MKKKLFQYIAVITTLAVVATGCQKGDLLSNPNASSESATVPVSLLLNHITYSFYAGGGVVDGRPGAVNETPWDLPVLWGQYYVSNYQYYRGVNLYNWSSSATAYDMLRYASKMDEQNLKQNGTTPNRYTALSKFFRAYSFVWLTQRVGDIPASQAGDATNLSPTYDTQHDVYKLALNLLDSANTILAASFSHTNPAGAVLDAQGDIYGLTNLQWQKVINTYKLRVLISLSKRSDDNADLNIKQQFATIVNNPATYPIMTGNGDNMVFHYNAAYNPYPIFARGNAPYNGYANMCSTLLNITTTTQDPRTFIAATPAPRSLKQGKTISDFTAYVGADITTPITTINDSSNAGKYSFGNYLRYYTSNAGANAEPYIILGYPELCFNIAEGINRGWASGASSTTWYTNGIKASLSWFGLSQGQSFTVGDVGGTSLGTVNIDINTFLNNVAYAGDNATGLNQILTQKYVAFFNNSGWEAFYNWRRTGVPAFAQGTSAIGTPSGLIPRRWQYPNDENLYNNANYTKALQSQYGGTDDLTKDCWLTK
jgi:hypothetical protein